MFPTSAPLAAPVPIGFPDLEILEEVIETHISKVYLTASHAYKVKKPVSLGFLDFSTLAARRFYCEEELRLNRRTAPSLYIGVLAITEDGSGPRVGGQGEPVDYAVRMRRFPQEALLDWRAAAGSLDGECLDAFAGSVARFHSRVERADAGRAYAAPRQVLAAALQNFDQIRAMTGRDDSALAALRVWTTCAHSLLAEVFGARKRDGFVRECHGDLHLGNIVVLEGGPVAFDCIEFNAAFRWIDVMNEVAFLVMDLRGHGLPGLAHRFLNRYLEITGDYGGLRVLRFYLVYRAMVRAKVAHIRADQASAPTGSRAGALLDYARYVSLAREISAEAHGALVVMHGLSGSGKSTVAAGLASTMHAVHVRSDVERKRLHGLAPDAHTSSGVASGIYGAKETEKTYERLADVARHALAAGFPVIVDASFLAARHRAVFRDLARECRVPFAIVSCAANEAELRNRVALRQATGADASEAGVEVLERQLAAYRPLALEESAEVVRVESDAHAATASQIAAVLTRQFGVRAG